MPTRASPTISPALPPWLLAIDQLMAHWRQTLPLPIFDVDYETLANGDPDGLHRLAQFLDVSPEPIVQASQSPVSGPITTSSVWQARQPLNTRSIGRWRNYAAFVPELTRTVRRCLKLIAAFATAINHFGQSP